MGNKQPEKSKTGKQVYLKVSQLTEVQEKDVFLKDVAKVFCQDPVLLSKCNSLKIKKIRENRFNGREVHVKTKNLRFILTVYAAPEAANTADVEVLSPAEALSLGMALSLDSAAAGFGAASGDYSLPLAALLTFLISLCAISGGCRLGRLLAAKSDFNFSVIGGILLLLLAFSKL